MEGVLGYDQEDALVRGQIPLKILQDQLDALEESSIKTIDFGRNGYCNDAVLKLIASKKKKTYENLEKVNLDGCILISNAGIKWLSDVIAGASKLNQIVLNGCDRLSDNELSLLLDKVGPTCEVLMNGTSVAYLDSPEGKKVQLVGCPNITVPKHTAEKFFGHALIIPHDSVEHSFAEFLKTNSLKKRESFHHVTDLQIEDWAMALTEMSIDHPLLDSMMSSNLTQVYIPFGESAVLKEIQSHVANTIARTITKTAFTSAYLKNTERKEKPVAVDIEVDDFLVPFNVSKQHFYDGDILGNFCYKSEILGVFISIAPFTRSHPYFEVELLEKSTSDKDKKTDPYKELFDDESDSDDSSFMGETKCGVLIGCLFGSLISAKNPLELDVDKGGEVATFDFAKGKRFGFGIDGNWTSEYIPDNKARFFATCDGVENNKDLTGAFVPREMLFPLIACLGDKDNSAKVKIVHMAKPPSEVTTKWEAQNKWITKGYMKDALIDNNGIISATSPEGYFESMNTVESGKAFTIKILEKGNFGKISIGLSPELDKDTKLSKKDSWIYQGVTGEVLSNESTKYLVDPCRVENGDILTVKLEKKGEGSIENVILIKNDKQIVETPFIPQKDSGRNFIKLIIVMEEENSKVQIMNYHPHYTSPAFFPESITVGRLHDFIVSDDGILEPCDKSKSVGVPPPPPPNVLTPPSRAFIAKHPLNSQMTSFEVEIKGKIYSLADSVFIGFCDSDIHYERSSKSKTKDINSITFGGGTVLLSNKANVYLENSTITPAIISQVEYTDKDIVKCTIEKTASAEKLQFDEDGSLTPQQDVLVKFYVSSVLVHEYTMTVRSGGLYPCVFMTSKQQDISFQIRNFYAETAENKKKANIKEKQTKKRKEEKKKETELTPCSEFKDCEYIIVEVGKTGGKLQLVEDQMKGEIFQDTIDTLTKHIQQHEKNFPSMDLNDQNKYASLCQAREKIENFSKSNRIKFMSLQKEGADKITENMRSIMNCRKVHQEVKFNLSVKASTNLERVLAVVEQRGIIEFGPGLIGLDFDTVKIEGKNFLQLAKILSEQGRIVMLQLCSKTIIASVACLTTFIDKLGKISSMEMSDKLSTAINESSHVWTSQSATSHFDFNSKLPVKRQILEDYLGLVEFPAWRQKTEDTQFLYTTLESLSGPPIPLREFWSQGDKTKDFIVMQKTFSFIHPVSDYVLSAVLSASTKFGRTLLLTGQGAVYQVGCVQTVIVKHQGLMGNTVISIESKCYIPDKKSGSVDELTEVYVREYTWNIFCLYCDMMEKILKQRDIIYMETGDYPTDLVNISVGCKHTWKQIPGKANQSVCTMCNKCCGLGRDCPYNGIMGDNLRECLCKTSIPGCIDCGICMDCAAAFWEIRSYLRPLPLTEKAAEEKVKPPVTAPDGDQKNVNSEDLNKNVFHSIPLDPVSYNEIEFQHISGAQMGITLKEIDDGSCISVFPGNATVISSLEGDQKISDKIKLLKNSSSGARSVYGTGDNIRIRITDPCKSIQLQEEKVEMTGVQESRVVYHSCLCREMTISHESGLLCYNSASSAVPVAQFVGPKPFSEDLKRISFKIINPGEKRTLGIGICPGKTYPANRMPGWNRWSIAYHADDGGIFIEAGFANSHVAICHEGDVMSMYCDITTRQLVFYKNDVEVKQIKINVPRGGYWPAIGMHSVGECVKLLEKEPWTPDPDDIPPKPSAFTTYKYGNMWISPARNISLTKKGYSSNHCGWMILHNPTKFLIGFKIKPESVVKTPVGSIAPNDTVPLFITKTPDITDDVTIQWISIEQVKEYNTEQILQLFDSSISIYSHKLALYIKDTKLGDVETLPPFIDDHTRDGFKLDLFKNSFLLDSYLLKRGRYMLHLVSLENKEVDYIIKRPKCPSFLYPSTLQKGMKVVVKLDEDMSGDQFADSVISEIYDGGGFCFEYTPPGKGSTGNEKICIGSMDCGIEDEDWAEIVEKGSKEEMKIQLLTSPNNMSLLYRTFVPAPPYLVTKGSSEALEMIDQEWKKTTLFNFSNCNQSITRPTVQEQIVTAHSRKLLKWLSYRDSSLPWSVVLLPSQLDANTLKYPIAMKVFSDVSVHRLCFFQDGYIDMTKMPMVFPSRIKMYPEVRSQYDDINIHSIAINDGKDERTYPLKQPREVCLHMMDLPGFKVKGIVPVDLSYGCLYQAWTYVALLTHKLLLPSYSKIFNGDMGELDRKQIESLLFNLIQPYASLCGIYAAQYGGLSNQENPPALSDKIKDLSDDPPIHISLLGKGMISDNHTFVKFPPFLACKAHSHSRVDKNIVRIKDLSLESPYYKPYSEKMDILMVNGSKMKSLPNNLFEIFENLQVLSILDVDLSDTPEFPSGISQCKDLEVLVLSALPGVKAMPQDILHAPALSTFYLHNCPIRSLDIDWPSTVTLTSLSLKGLLITKVPREIGNLSELNELILDCNPITTLPDELQSLKKLKTLSVKGIPWISFEGRYDQMPKSIYDTWHAENPYLINYLSQEEVNALFTKYDTNNNNILDPGEAANLNFEFLTRIPRIGVTMLGQDPNTDGDEDNGGVPEVIFKLKSLEHLDLSYTGVHSIPDKASELFTLQTLNLEHCPFLETVSGNLGLLPNLRSLHLNSCPMLESPPQDIVGRGFDSVRAFLKKMAGGYTECHRTKLMFIGLGQAGKTTLLQALKSPLKKTPGTQDAKLTDGIEIKPWVVPVQDQYDITYSCWDFAGQTVYYNTHQFFLSKQAVYMLLWNMRMGFEHAGLDFWLCSVACHCPNAPVIVVGTQLDQIPMPDIPEKELMKKYPQIKKFCYVSSTVGTGVAELEKTLIDVTMTYCSQMKLKIPKVWLNFEDCILVERKRGRNVIEWTKLKQYAIENGIYDEKDIRLAVQFLDDLGTVQYFDTELLRDRVVINPQWIVDVMAKVVSVNEKYIKENKGRFLHKYISEIWKDYDTSLHEWMLKLTERFDLTFPLPEAEQNANVVPCLLPEEEPENLPWPMLEDAEGVRESKIEYKFTYLPTGLFNRAQARLFSQGFTDNNLLEFLWKKGSILKKNNHYALVKQTSDYDMIVYVQGPRPKNILDLIHETISTLIKDSFQGVDYDFYLPCPDCVEKEGTKDPFLFKADMISRAHSVNAPFLQCTKYFHTISIGELISIMPDNRETEFDVQIQESIGTLQEISTNMAQDVAILYCPEDIPPPGKEGEMVDPRQINKDLKEAGFNCWFPEDMEKTTQLEMTLAIKNAKVLAVAMTRNFPSHPICHQMFLYAIEQLAKPYALGIIDESDDWRTTDLGFKVGNPKMAMIKNVKRYEKKIEDLKDIVKDNIMEIDSKVKSHPKVFISYCWANSREACSNTTEPKEGSLGYGDPRVLKKHLEDNGIPCWLDIEQMGKFGLYQDITLGLQNAKVLVCCVSDEYLQSDPCMMEARFGVYNLQLPMVVCVVGQRKAWKTSEVSLMIQRCGESAEVVKMQKERPGAYDEALEHVKKFLNQPESEKTRKVKEKIAKQQKQFQKDELEKKIKQQGDTNFSFQEEIELIQRKFMRHILKITRADDLEHELPKLLVFDFVKKAHSIKKPDDGDSHSVTDQERPTTSQSLRPKLTKTYMSKDKMKPVTLEELEDDWQGEDFCIRVMCEDEQGWHLVGEPLSLINRTSEEIYKALKDASPYLARIYAILKQSALPLNCMDSKKGESFLSYIRKEGIGTKNFSDAYKVIQKLVAESEDKDKFISPLNRCYLQSGKISWLCPGHQNKGGITQLQLGTSSIHGTARTLLFEEDNLLKELLHASPLYQEKTQGRKGTVLDLEKQKSTVQKESGPQRRESSAKNVEKIEMMNDIKLNSLQENKEKKKTEKSVKISDTTTQIPSSTPPGSRPVSETSSTGHSNTSSTRSLIRKKSQRKTNSQACSIQ